jgi:hypothetical protein
VSDIATEVAELSARLSALEAENARLRATAEPDSRPVSRRIALRLGGLAAGAAGAAMMLRPEVAAAQSLEASAVSIADVNGDFDATNVEDALAELHADLETDATNLANHVADATDAHGAAAISAIPNADGELAGSTVADQLLEVATRTTALSLFNDAADALVVVEYFMNTDVGSGQHGTHNWSHVVANSGSVHVINGSFVAVFGGGRILRTLATASSHAAIGLGPQTLLRGTPVFVWEWVVKLSLLSDATNAYSFSVGTFGQIGTTPITDGIYFEHRKGAANWRCICRNNGLTTERDSGVPVTTSEFRLRAISDGGTSAVFFINNLDRPVATITSNLPGSTRTTGPAARMTRTAGTAERNATVHRFVGRFENTVRSAP